MFNQISWQSYWLTLALLLAGYYLAIYLLYYRSDFKIGFPRKSSGGNESSPVPLFYSKNQPPSGGQSTLFDENVSEFKRPETNTEEHVAYSCMDELAAFFEEAKRRKWAKEELMQALQGILRKYPSLKTSSYLDSLNNVLTSECEHNCSIHLSAEDVVHVWFGV